MPQIHPPIIPFAFPFQNSSYQQQAHNLELASMFQISKSESEELLYLPSKNGQVWLIKNLLRAKVDINALNAEGLSSFHLAVIEGNIEVTKLLISQGAKMGIKSFTLPIHYILQQANKCAFKVIVHHCFRETYYQIF